jgi:hypothetical protein
MDNYKRIKRDELTDLFVARLIKAINKQTIEDYQNPSRLEKKWEQDSITDLSFLKKLNNLQGGLYNG